MDCGAAADEHPPFSRGGYVIGAVIVALASILLGLALIASNPLASGLVLAAGAAIDGHIARRVGARSMMPRLYALAALVLIACILLSWIFR